MPKSRQNKNDRKRQRRKEFSHGRDWTANSPHQRSPFGTPGNSIIRTRLPVAAWRALSAIDIAPGGLTYLKPDPSLGLVQSQLDALKQIERDLIQTMVNPPVIIPDQPLSGGIKNLSSANFAALQKEIQAQQQAYRDAAVQAANHSHKSLFHAMLYGADFAEEETRPALRREMQAGEIIAYRAWRYEDGLLRSVYQPDWWKPGHTLVGREINDWGKRGVHAWKERNSEPFNEYVRDYMRYRCRLEHVYSTVIVTGSVYLWGDVVEHEFGYRAEFARIKSIDWLYPGVAEMGREAEILDKLRRLYLV